MSVSFKMFQNDGVFINFSNLSVVCSITLSFLLNFFLPSFPFIVYYSRISLGVANYPTYVSLNSNKTILWLSIIILLIALKKFNNNSFSSKQQHFVSLKKPVSVFNSPCFLCAFPNFVYLKMSVININIKQKTNKYVILIFCMHILTFIYAPQ